jgi:hypothetical protein
MDRSHYPTRVVPLHGQGDDDRELRDLPPGTLVEMVWQLTLQAWAFKEGLTGEPRLRRDVGRVVGRKG